MKSWDETQLLTFIQQHLKIPLKPADAQKLLDAGIDGEAFLYAAMQPERLFHQVVGLSIGAGLKVEQLAKIAKADTEGKFYLIITSQTAGR